jgi:hypothetical protein
MPYPTGRFSRWTLSLALRARLRSCCPSGKYILRAEALIKLAPMGLTLLSPGFQPWLCTHPGRKVKTWKKRRSTVRTEHRLEAYATLAFRTVERSPRVHPRELSPCTCSDDATALMQHSFQPVFLFTRSSGIYRVPAGLPGSGQRDFSINL